MKKVLPKVFLFFILISISSCHVEPVTFSSVQNVKFGKIDALKGTVECVIGLKLNNPNNFAVTVYAMDLDVKVAGVSLGKVTITDKVKIEKKKEDVYNIPVNAQLNFAQIFSNIPKLLDAIQKKKADVEISGTIKAGNSFFKKSFPVKLSQQDVQTLQL